MELVHVIRHKVLVEGLPKRQVARELNIGRNTVDRYLAGKEPGKRVRVAKRRPEHDAIEQRIVQILDDSPRWTHGKQKLTAMRLWHMLSAEGVEVGYTFVKDVVREYRRERREVFVPLVYRPGEVAEVDFFEVVVEVQGERQKAWLFVMRLMHSGRDFVFLYPRQDATCFLDGHVRTFAHLGGIPWRIIYDNLKPAVAQILVGAERKLTARFQALATHYAFEPCFARPATGHDKGGVESRGRAIRWQHFVPIPTGNSLQEISVALQAKLDAAAHDGRLEAERRCLLPMPVLPFVAAKTTTQDISRQSLVKVDGAVYSVPCEHGGLEAVVHAGVFDIDIACPGGVTVRHARQPFGGKGIDYHHYLRELRKKPQAVRQVADVLVAQLGEPFGGLWVRLVEDHGEKEAARHLAKVLGAIVDLGKEAVASRIREGRLPLLVKSPPPPPVVAVPEPLRGFKVEASDMGAYDALLGAPVGGAA